MKKILQSLTLALLTFSLQADYKVEVYLGMEDQALHKGQMDYPFGVEFDQDNQMYIVEYDGSCVSLLKKDGSFVKLGGNPKRGPAFQSGLIRDAEFNGLHNVIIDDQGFLYITDTFNHALRRYDPKTQLIDIDVSGKLGYLDGPAKDSKFNELYCAAFTPDKKHIIIADLKNNRIRSYDLKNNMITTIAGNGKRGIPADGTPALEAPFMDPRAVCVDSKGQIYIADRGGHALRKIDEKGNIVTLVNTKGKKGLALGPGPQAQLNGPKYLSVDKDDKIYIADDENHRICVYDPQTKELSALIGVTSNIPDIKLKRPHGLTMHKSGDIYVVDSGHDRILRLTPDKK